MTALDIYLERWCSAHTLILFLACPVLSCVVVIAGHSFGAGTAFTFGLRNPDTVRRVLCLDAWLYSLKESDLCRKLPRDGEECRILFVDMDSADMRVSREIRKRLDTDMFESVTVLGGMHNNSSDFPIFVPKFLAVPGKMTSPNSNPEDLLKAQNIAACAFLNGNWNEVKQEISRSPGGELHGLSFAAPRGPAYVA